MRTWHFGTGAKPASDVTAVDKDFWSATSATFTATAGTIFTTSTANITACLNSNSSCQTFAIQVVPLVTVTGLTCNRSSLSSGHSVTCSVTLSAAAPGGGVTVNLASGNGSLLTVPASITVAAGSISGTFPAVAGTSSTIDSAMITASYNNIPQSLSDRPAPGLPNLATTLVTPTVTIGGVNATPVLFSGLAPTFVGLYQINVQVPSNAPTGSAVPIVVTGGNAQSASGVTFAVQ